MGIEIKKLTEPDLPAICELMAEFAEYEKLSAYLSFDRSAYTAAMFGPDSFVEGLLALSDGKPVGYAIFYPCFATFRSMPGMFLEDLFVSDKSRGTGLGHKLLCAVAKRANERGFKRIDLHVLDWNSPAIDFYKKRGADGDSSDLHYRFVGEAFRKLVE